MMRAALVGTGTVVGVGVVLALNPTGAAVTALTVPQVPVGLPTTAGSNFGPVAPAGPKTPSSSRTAAPLPSPSSSHQHAARAVSSPGPVPTRSHATAAARTAPASAAPTRAAARAPSAAASPAPTPTPTPTPTPSTATATGPAVVIGPGNGNDFGVVQVQATVSAGRLIDVRWVQLPDYFQTSVQISEYAWPILRQEALQAQSAQVANVTSATYTTQGFQQSLRGALLALGHSA